MGGEREVGIRGRPASGGAMWPRARQPPVGAVRISLGYARGRSREAGRDAQRTVKPTSPPDEPAALVAAEPLLSRRPGDGADRACAAKGGQGGFAGSAGKRAPGAVGSACGLIAVAAVCCGKSAATRAPGRFGQARRAAPRGSLCRMRFRRPWRNHRPVVGWRGRARRWPPCDRRPGGIIARRGAAGLNRWR